MSVQDPDQLGPAAAALVGMPVHEGAVGTECRIGWCAPEPVGEATLTAAPGAAATCAGCTPSATHA